MSFFSPSPHSWGSWVLTCSSPFAPVGGSLASSFSKLRCLVERGEARNFLLQMCPNLFVLLVQESTGISSLEPSTKARSSVGVCPIQCFPGVPGLQPRGVRIISQVPVSSRDHMGICLLHDTQVGKTPPWSLGQLCSISQLPQRYFWSWLDAEF